LIWQPVWVSTEQEIEATFLDSVSMEHPVSAIEKTVIDKKNLISNIRKVTLQLFEYKEEKIGVIYPL